MGVLGIESLEKNLEADGQDSGTVAGRGGQRYKGPPRAWEGDVAPAPGVHLCSLSPLPTTALVALWVPFLVPTVLTLSVPPHLSTPVSVRGLMSASLPAT